MNKNVLKARKQFLMLADIATDKGVLVIEGELEVGKEVMMETPEGEWEPAPDGEYFTEDNRTIVVEGGKIADIKENIAEPEEPAEEEEPEPPLEIQEEDEEPAEEPAEEPEMDKDARIAELEARVAELEAMNAELEAENAELKAKLDEAETELKASAAKPAKEEFKATEKKALFKLKF